VLVLGYVLELRRLATATDGGLGCYCRRRAHAIAKAHAIA
jgi:hypothetical protein